MCSPYQPIGPQPHPLRHAVANPVVLRGLLDKKKSEEHLQSSNERRKIKQNKNDENKGTITQSTYQKNIEGDSIERVGIVPAARHPIPSSDRNHHAPKRIASTTLYSEGSRFLYRHSQSTSLRDESLAWPNKRGSKTYQACDGHLRCSLNLVHLFRFSCRQRVMWQVTG